VVIPASFGWSDVGSWSAIPEVAEADSLGNVIISANNAITLDSCGCLVYGGNKLVALVGVKDMIVINTDDALLVCANNRAQDVRQVVAELENRGLKEYL
jgi:mannose-1-phosphate guanylyltransferase